MVKQYSKSISYKTSKFHKKINSLPYRDFLIFRKKFCGMFIFKGKKTSSFKIFNYIYLNLKKAYRRKRVNPNKIFFVIIKRITPFLTLKQQRHKGNLIGIPSVLYGNKKNIFLLNWIVRQTRNKSNIFGIKKEDVLKNLIDILNKRGPILRMKEEHNRKVLLAKINLKNEGIQISGVSKEEIERKEYIESKYEYWRQEIERLNEDLRLPKEELEAEFERWKEIESIYAYERTMNRLFKRNIKNKEFLYYYKKLFVK